MRVHVEENLNEIRKREDFIKFHCPKRNCETFRVSSTGDGNVSRRI